MIIHVIEGAILVMMVAQGLHMFRSWRHERSMQRISVGIDKIDEIEKRAEALQAQVDDIHRAVDEIKAGAGSAPIPRRPPLAPSPPPMRGAPKPGPDYDPRSM